MLLPALLWLSMAHMGDTANKDNLNALVKSRPDSETLKIQFPYEAGQVWTSAGRNLINRGHKGEPAQLWKRIFFSSGPAVVQKGACSVPAPALRLSLRFQEPLSK